MREIRSSGSVEGVVSDHDPYSDYVAGTIGAQTLRQFKVIFDYPHREMILEPNDHFGDPS